MKKTRLSPRTGILFIAVVVAVTAVYLLFVPRDRKTIPVEERKDFVVGGLPHSIAVGTDAIWVTDTEGKSVAKVDPTTGRVSRTRLGFIPGDVAAAGDYVWVAAIEGRSIARLDASTGDVVDTIDVGRTPQSLTVAGDRIWVAAFDGGFVQAVDSSSGELDGDRIKSKDSFPSAVAWGYDSLWVADVVDDVVDRIHSSGETKEIPVGDSPTDIVVGEGSVWTANFNERTITRIDPASDQVEQPILVGAKPGGIATGSGYVWVTRPSDDTLIRVDAESGAWTGEVLDVGPQPQSLAVDGSVLWIANQGDGTISRIEVKI